MDDIHTGKQVRALLDDAAASLPPHVQLRLDSAVMAALQVQKLGASATTASATSASASTAGRTTTPIKTHLPGSGLNAWLSDVFGWLNRPAVSFALSAAFVLTAAAGVIQETQNFEDMRLGEFAEVDAEILSDELPTEAYLDPGFVNFSNEQMRKRVTPLEAPQDEELPASDSPST